MAEQKTTKSEDSVEDFLDTVESPERAADARAVLQIFRDTTGDPGAMWGPSIVGFDSYDYEYASGRTGTSFRVGFSPRKSSLTLYIPEGFDSYAEMLASLGPNKVSRSCLHLKRLADADESVLRELIATSFATRHPNEVRPG